MVLSLEGDTSGLLHAFYLPGVGPSTNTPAIFVRREGHAYMVAFRFAHITRLVKVCFHQGALGQSLRLTEMS